MCLGSRWCMFQALAVIETQHVSQCTGAKTFSGATRALCLLEPSCLFLEYLPLAKGQSHSLQYPSFSDVSNELTFITSELWDCGIVYVCDGPNLVRRGACASTSLMCWIFGMYVCLGRWGRCGAYPIDSSSVSVRRFWYHGMWTIFGAWGGGW